MITNWCDWDWVRESDDGWWDMNRIDMIWECKYKWKYEMNDMSNDDNDIPVCVFSNNDDENNVLLKRVSERNKNKNGHI